MKIIKSTTNNEDIFVDDEDYEQLSKFNWSTGNRYACRFITVKNKRMSLYMHRILLNADKGKEVDHIDNNKLNNQRSNLRICTSSENKWNVGIKKSNKSGIVGVCWSIKANKWQASIRCNGKRFYLGVFESIEEANETLQRFKKNLHGEFARG